MSANNTIIKNSTTGETYPNLFQSIKTNLVETNNLKLSGISLASAPFVLHYNPTLGDVSYFAGGGGGVGATGPTGPTGPAGGGGSSRHYVFAAQTSTRSISVNTDTLLDFDSIQTSLGWTSGATGFTWTGGSTKIFQVSFIGYVKSTNLNTGIDAMYNLITRNGTTVNNSGGIAMVGTGFGAIITDNVLVSTALVSLNNNDVINVRATCNGINAATDFQSPSFTAAGRVFNPSSYTVVIQELT